MSDVWDSANDARLPPKVYFGQLLTDGYYCVLEKGVGKVPFDPQQHSEDRKLSLIKIDGQVTRKNGSTYELSREIIAEFKDWAGIVLPSLRICGVHPRDMNERWAKWEMKNTGRTWTDRDTGEEKHGTTFKFLEFFDSEAACRAAEKAHYSRGNGNGQTAQAPTENLDATHPMPEEGDNGADNSADPAKAVASRFLPALWGQANNDVAQFSALIAANPLTSKYFDLNSPEVLELVAGKAA